MKNNVMLDINYDLSKQILLSDKKELQNGSSVTCYIETMCTLKFKILSLIIN